jgi:hypothetical protein
VIEATATAPDAPADGPDRVSHVWRIVLFVVAAQLAVIAVGMLLFSSMGFADAGGGCGGG